MSFTWFYTYGYTLGSWANLINLKSELDTWEGMVISFIWSYSLLWEGFWTLWLSCGPNKFCSHPRFLDIWNISSMRKKNGNWQKYTTRLTAKRSILFLAEASVLRSTRVPEEHASHFPRQSQRVRNRPPHYQQLQWALPSQNSAYNALLTNLTCITCIKKITGTSRLVINQDNPTKNSSSPWGVFWVS